MFSALAISLIFPACVPFWFVCHYYIFTHFSKLDDYWDIKLFDGINLIWTKYTIVNHLRMGQSVNFEWGVK